MCVHGPDTVVSVSEENLLFPQNVSHQKGGLQVNSIPDVQVLFDTADAPVLFKSNKKRGPTPRGGFAVSFYI